MITIRRYFDPVEAELVHGRLAADGIEARLCHSALQNISHALVEVLLQVDPDDAGRAETVLQAVEQDGIEIGDQWIERDR